MPKLCITNITQLHPDSVAQSVESMLFFDLNTISEAIKSEDYSALERSSPEELADALKKITTILPRLNSSSQKEVEKSLRCFVFLLERHYPNIVLTAAASSSSYIDPLQQAMKSISENSGFAPFLLNDIELPEPHFLPPDIEKTITRWKTIPCPNPRRTAKTIQEGKIDFIKRGGKSSVRLQLEANAATSSSSVAVPISSEETETFYLNLIEFEYYKLGLMHADHLLPSESMINRLKEMIEIMNYDPSFAQEMRKLGYFNQYFLDTTDGIVGTYWLYMEHHNSMENLWFLLASDNTGEGKLATDPIEWLESRQIGKLYLQELESQGKSIDKRYILYKVSDGVSLKDSFITWVNLNREKIITVCSELARLHGDLRQTVIATVDATSDRTIRSSVERQAMYHSIKSNITKPKATFDDDADHSSDVSTASSDEKEQFEKRFSQKLSNDPENQAHEKSGRKRKRKLARDTIKELRSEAKAESDNDSSDDDDPSLIASRMTNS